MFTPTLSLKQEGRGSRRCCWLWGKEQGTSTSDGLAGRALATGWCPAGERKDSCVSRGNLSGRAVGHSGTKGGESWTRNQRGGTSPGDRRGQGRQPLPAGGGRPSPRPPVGSHPAGSAPPLPLPAAGSTSRGRHVTLRPSPRSHDFSRGRTLKVFLRADVVPTFRTSSPVPIGPLLLGT